MGLRDGKPMSSETPISDETVADLLGIDTAGAAPADGTLARPSTGLLDLLVHRKFPIRLRDDTYLALAGDASLRVHPRVESPPRYPLSCEMILVVRGRTTGPERLPLPAMPLPTSGEVITVGERELRTLEQVIAWYDDELDRIVKGVSGRLRRMQSAAERDPDGPDPWPSDAWPA